MPGRHFYQYPGTTKPVIQLSRIGNSTTPVAYYYLVTSKISKAQEQLTYFNSGIAPFVKWPGGKSSELPKIEIAMPAARIDRFIEPFVGGGSALLALDPIIPACANDICPELISLYESSKDSNLNLHCELQKLSTFWNSVTFLECKWIEIADSLMIAKIGSEEACKVIHDYLSPLLEQFNLEFCTEFARRLNKDLPTKLKRITKIQIQKNRELPLSEYADNIEGSIRAAFYMAVRRRYNTIRVSGLTNNMRVADFFFLREYCYASMFRFNSKDEFNIPYGGVSYNRKDFEKKIARLYSPETKHRLSNTAFYNLDFQNFFEEVQPKKSDFIFVDPPYDSDFTDYDAKEFRGKDQERLANTLSSLQSTVMIVIGDTELIRKLYPASHWRIQEDQLTYKWTIKERNEREKTHLTITNY